MSGPVSNSRAPPCGDAPARPRLDPSDALTLDRGVDLELELERVAAWRARGRTIDMAPPDVVARELDARLPRRGAPLDEVLDEVDRVARGFGRNNAHPGFFGYVCGPGLPTDPMAHALVAALNQNVTGFPSAPGPTTIERTVVSWFAALAGLPAEAGGLFTSGGSIGNLTALAAALGEAYGDALRREGLAAVSAAKGAPRVYRGPSAHFSIDRAAALLGVGERGVREIPADPSGRADARALAALLDEDARAGARPVCVVATAGATTTGSIDPVDAIAEVCRARGVWLHVDAAYGGAALLSPALRSKLAGVEQADSIVIDLHKAIYLALDASVVLLRRPRALSAAFYMDADYASLPRDGEDAEFAFYHRGVETSRRFRALPAWIALRHFGLDRLGANVAHNVACAEYLAERCRRAADLEVVSPPSLGIVCFRYVPAGCDAARLDGLNEAIRQRLLTGGSFYLSGTRFAGKAVLRVCLCNHATTADVLDRLLDDVTRVGAELMGRG